MPLGMYYQKALIATLTKKSSPGAGLPIQSPTSLYISSHTANPTALYTTALSTEVNKVTYTNYARCQITCDASPGLSVDDGAQWSPLLDENDANEVVDTPLATQIGVHNNFDMLLVQFHPGLVITHLGVWRVATGGTATDYLYFGVLPFPIDVSSEDFVIHAGGNVEGGTTYGPFRIGVK